MKKLQFNRMYECLKLEGGEGRGSVRPSVILQSEENHEKWQFRLSAGELTQTADPVLHPTGKIGALHETPDHTELTVSKV